MAWRPSHLSQHNLPPSLLLLLVCSTNSVTDFDDEALLKKQLLLPMMMLSTAALHCTLFQIRRHGTTQMLHSGLGHRV